MRVAWLGTFNSLPDFPHWKGIREAVKKLHPDHLLLDYYQLSDDEIVRRLNEYAPEAVVHTLTDSVARNLIKRSPPCRQVMWYCDYTFFHKGFDNPLKGDTGLNTLLLCTEDQIHLYKERLGIEDVQFLPMASIPDLDPHFSRTKEQCVTPMFEGSMAEDGIYADRTNLVRSIKAKVPELQVIPLPHGAGSYRLESAQEARRALCTLSISAINKASLYTSPRLFQIVLQGGLPLVKRFPGLELMFPECVAVESFEVEEWARKIEMVRHNFDAMESLRHRMLEHALLWHTYEQRIKELMDILCGRPLSSIIFAVKS